MAQLLELPAELLALVTSFADTDSLKSLRLTNHLLSFFASESLFRIVHLYDDDESCEAFKSIISHPTFKDKVQRIYLNTVEYDYDSDDEGEDEPPENWRELFTKLETLPNLRSVALRFDKNCAANPEFSDKPQTELYRATVMRWLFAGLRSLQQPLKELAIQNHQSVSPRNEETIAQIQQVLKRLTSLRLNVVHERDYDSPEIEVEIPDLHEFYTQILPSVWLKPSMGSLQKLSLYSTDYWGFYPKANLDGVNFPHLKSLTLGRFSFVDDKQLDWILTHSSTLQEIYLDDCAILTSVMIFDGESDLSKCQIPESDLELREAGGHRSFHYAYPRRWHDYFSSIQKGLPNLRQFGFGVSTSWLYNLSMLPFEKEKEIIPALMKERYVVFDGDGGPSPFSDLSDYLEFNTESEWLGYGCDEKDKNALKALYQNMGQQVDCGRINIGPQRIVEDLLQID